MIRITVTFQANSGTGNMAAQSFTHGVAAKLNANTFIRSGYTFAGWNTKTDGKGTAYADKSEVTLTGNLTLYAQWKATYTVSYNANEGTGTPSPQIKEENVPLMLSSITPSKAYVLRYNANGGSVSPASKNVNCVFNNWNTEKNGSGTSYVSGGSYKINADVTLYAQWINPVSGTLATPSRSGYDFVGWFTSATGGVQVDDSSIVTGNMTIYAHWTDPYNLGDETYSFQNYGDSDSPYGHCFGMSMTSAGYHNSWIDIGRIGGNANTPLYSLGATQTVKQPICYYQGIQGSFANNERVIVAGGSLYLHSNYNITSDWQAVVNYVRNHDYDNKGLLQIAFRKDGEGGHAINFLRYENVSGQDRIYAYDNNFPTKETYFYQDSSGNVRQTPVQTFSGAIDCIGLRDCSTYFKNVSGFDATRVLYMAKDAANVQGYNYSYMDGVSTEEEYVMYEIPSDHDRVIIIPNRDYADFIYMGTEYSFSEITSETRGELRLASMDDSAMNTDAIFRIFEIDSSSPTVTLNKTYMTLVEGESEALSVTIMPENAANKNVTWSSNNTTVVSVSENGEVVALSHGSAEITVTTVDGNCSETVQVRVYKSGDVNGDDKVDMRDLILLGNYLARKKGVSLSSIIPEASDVDNKKGVAMTDLITLGNHLAHRRGYENLPHR